MAKSRLQIAGSKIVRYFERNAPSVLRKSDISRVLQQNRESWNLAQSMPLSTFISYLTTNAGLRQAKFQFPDRNETRFFREGTSVYALAMSMKPAGYFTHYAAMGLHDLTDQIPKTLYLNFEQSPKVPPDAALEQSRIDLAFRRKPRASNRIASFGDYRICLLNGMHTGNLGVIDIRTPEGETVRVASVERTLIDIAVRPFYAGGVFEVLKAYQRARDLVNVQELVAMLRKLDYTYPYHQAIGFYLEKSGAYSEDEIGLLQQFKRDFDFYLTHEIRQRDYSDRWRLFFPKGF